MKKLKTKRYLEYFNESLGDKKYIQIIEICGHEGETWSFFLNKKGNEPFIKKLKKTIKKYPNLDWGDSEIKIGHDNIPESEVDILLKYNTSGYMSLYNKIDDVINPDVIEDGDEDEFVESFYKGKYFV